MILHAYVVIFLLGSTTPHEYHITNETGVSKPFDTFFACFREAHLLAADRAENFAKRGQTVGEVAVVCQRSEEKGEPT